MSPEQRAVIGFPAVTSSYWTAETLAATARRYPELDLSPYTEAVEAKAAATVQANAKL